MSYGDILQALRLTAHGRIGPEVEAFAQKLATLFAANADDLLPPVGIAAWLSDPEVTTGVFAAPTADDAAFDAPMGLLVVTDAERFVIGGGMEVEASALLAAPAGGIVPATPKRSRKPKAD